MSIWYYDETKFITFILMQKVLKKRLIVAWFIMSNDRVFQCSYFLVLIWRTNVKYVTFWFYSDSIILFLSWSEKIITQVIWWKVSWLNSLSHNLFKKSQYTNLKIVWLSRNNCDNKMAFWLCKPECTKMWY